MTTSNPGLEDFGPDYEYVLVSYAGTDNRIGIITLNRPEKMNALSQELLYELNDALHMMEADSSVRVVILKGAGRTFSAGYDLAPAQRSGADGVVRSHRGATADGKRLLMGTRTGMQNITDIHMYFWNMDKVTIAQVHGYALAGGCELCMMADLVVAAEDAQMGHPGLRGLGTSRTGLIWPLVIGMRKCKELMYTGENISGLEAEECGMVNYAWPIDELDARTIAVSAPAPFESSSGTGNSRSVRRAVRGPHRRAVGRPPRHPQGQRQPLLREHGHLQLRALEHRSRRRRPVHRVQLQVSAAALGLGCGRCRETDGSPLL